MHFSMITMLIPVFFIVLLVLIVVSVRGQAHSNEGGEVMIKKVFIYLVLFATLMMTIGGSVAVFMAVADIVAPAPSYYQTFEDYRRGMMRPYPEYEGETALSEAELRERYDAMIEQQRESRIERAKNSLVKSLGWIVIPLPVFIYFQRQLAREEKAKGSGKDDVDSSDSL